jgi:hypothetical protein
MKTKSRESKCEKILQSTTFWHETADKESQNSGNDNLGKLTQDFSVFCMFISGALAGFSTAFLGPRATLKNYTNVFLNFPSPQGY